MNPVIQKLEAAGQKVEAAFTAMWQHVPPEAQDQITGVVTEARGAISEVGAAAESAAVTVAAAELPSLISKEAPAQLQPILTLALNLGLQQIEASAKPGT